MDVQILLKEEQITPELASKFMTEPLNLSKDSSFFEFKAQALYLLKRGDNIDALVNLISSTEYYNLNSLYSIFDKFIEGMTTSEDPLLKLIHSILCCNSTVAALIPKHSIDILPDVMGFATRYAPTSLQTIVDSIDFSLCDPWQRLELVSICGMIPASVSRETLFNDVFACLGLKQSRNTALHVASLLADRKSLNTAVELIKTTFQSQIHLVEEKLPPYLDAIVYYVENGELDSRWISCIGPYMVSHYSATVRKLWIRLIFSRFHHFDNSINADLVFNTLMIPICDQKLFKQSLGKDALEKLIVLLAEILAKKPELISSMYSLIDSTAKHSPNLVPTPTILVFSDACCRLPFEAVGKNSMYLAKCMSMISNATSETANRFAEFCCNAVLAHMNETDVSQLLSWHPVRVWPYIHQLLASKFKGVKFENIHSLQTGCGFLLGAGAIFNEDVMLQLTTCLGKGELLSIQIIKEHAMSSDSIPATIPSISVTNENIQHVADLVAVFPLNYGCPVSLCNIVRCAELCRLNIYDCTLIDGALDSVLTTSPPRHAARLYLMAARNLDNADASNFFSSITKHTPHALNIVKQIVNALDEASIAAKSCHLFRTVLSFIKNNLALEECSLLLARNFWCVSSDIPSFKNLKPTLLHTIMQNLHLDSVYCNAFKKDPAEFTRAIVTLYTVVEPTKTEVDWLNISISSRYHYLDCLMNLPPSIRTQMLSIAIEWLSVKSNYPQLSISGDKIEGLLHNGGQTNNRTNVVIRRYRFWTILYALVTTIDDEQVIQNCLDAMLRAASDPNYYFEQMRVLLEDVITRSFFFMNKKALNDYLVNFVSFDSPNISYSIPYKVSASFLLSFCRYCFEGKPISINTLVTIIFGSITSAPKQLLSVANVALHLLYTRIESPEESDYDTNVPSEIISLLSSLRRDTKYLPQEIISSIQTWRIKGPSDLVDLDVLNCFNEESSVEWPSPVPIISLTDVTFTAIQRKVEISERRCHPLIVVASLMDKPVNLANLCRTCEVLGVERLAIANKDSILGLSEFKSVTLASHLHLPIDDVHPDDLPSYFEDLSKKGYIIHAIEQCTTSVQMETYTFPKKSVLVLGNEARGMPASVLSMCDKALEIKQLGVTASLNAATAAALGVYSYCGQQVK